MLMIKFNTILKEIQIFNLIFSGCWTENWLFGWRNRWEQLTPLHQYRKYKMNSICYQKCSQIERASKNRLQGCAWPSLWNRKIQGQESYQWNHQQGYSYSVRFRRWQKVTFKLLRIFMSIYKKFSAD